MKNVLFFLILVTYLQQIHAQIVNIPDANFKTKLIALGVDTNNDGQIQHAEAEAVTNLYVNNSSISSLVGIEAFLNLEALNCNMNFLSSLDVSNLVYLRNLSCINNDISALSITTSVNLEVLTCRSNLIQSLDVSNCPNLWSLDYAFNQIPNLDISTCINLSVLKCEGNQISNLALNNCPNLEILSCGGNNLQTLDLSNCPKIKQLGCGSNQLTNLDVSNLDSLNWFSCTDNQLVSLDVSNLTVLSTLGCNNNLLTNLNLSNTSSLANVNCDDNNLTNLDLSTCTNLSHFDCKNNQITILDASLCPHLGSFTCANNQIQALLIKNGSVEGLTSFNNNPLVYICADGNQISALQQVLNQYGMTNVAVSAFCTATLGGSYNTLSGKMIYDETLNGCTPADIPYPYLNLLIIKNSDSASISSNLIGDYQAYLPEGTFTLIPQFENPTYYSANPATSSIYFPNNNGSLQIQDFCITPNGTFPDIEVSIIPVNAARPGFTAHYKLWFHNKGTNSVNGNLQLDFMGNKMTFLNASLSPSSQSTNLIVWAYSNLLPFETREIDFYMDILPPPTNNVGEVITFTAIATLAGDVYTADNLLHFNQTLMGPYDPNRKTCLQGTQLSNSQIGEYLHYLIDFQNVGNFYAEDVVVVDSIDANKFDISSLQVLEMSHAGSLEINNDVAVFSFDQIMLQDSFSNEPLSHGYILFKIKTKSNLPLYSVVKNKVGIYFDYNLPIITNTAVTTFGSGVSVSAALPQGNLKCYPNPAQDILTIEVENPSDFAILNALGATVLKGYIFEKEALYISHLPQGLYILQTESGRNKYVFVKE